MKKLWNFKLDFIRRNPILSSLISFLKGVIFTLIVCCLLSSCSPKLYSPSDRVTHILGVNQSGDTIKIPLRDIQNRIPQSQWYSPFYTTPFFHWRYYNNPRPIIIQPQPKYMPHRFDNRPNPPIRRERIEIPNRGRVNPQPPMRREIPNRVKPQQHR